MKSINLLLVLFALSIISCNAPKNDQSKTEKETEATERNTAIMQVNPVYEIAVRLVKEGKKAEFVEQRRQFISLLKAQEGVSNDREFQSFFALPEPDPREVFIGMTQYASPETLQTVQGNIYSAFAPFAETMDLKAYLFVQPSEGDSFDLGSLASQQGQVLEVAVRRVKDGQEENFQKTRKAFVNWLDAQEGVLGSWEFKVVSGQDTERITVGMSVYASQEAFQAVSAKSQSLAEAGQYFATFDPVALQYASSTTNE